MALEVRTVFLLVVVVRGRGCSGDGSVVSSPGCVSFLVTHWAIYLGCVHFFLYVCHTSGEKLKTATNNKTYEGSRNGNSLDNLKREPSALFASFFSKAIYSARCHHKNQHPSFSSWFSSQQLIPLPYPFSDLLQGRLWRNFHVLTNRLANPLDWMPLPCFQGPRNLKVTFILWPTQPPGSQDKF